MPLAPQEEPELQLNLAIKDNDLEWVKQLLGDGANPNGEGSGGYIPLDIAIENDRVECAAILVESGASVDRSASYLGPLIDAIFNVGTSERMIELLLNSGADPNYAFEGTSENKGVRLNAGWTPLHFATTVNDPAKRMATVRLLLSFEADPSARALDGYAPIHNAVRFCSSEPIELLVGHGASFNLKDAKFLFEAARYGCSSLVVDSVEAGVDLDSKDRYGKTALYLAAGSFDLATINALLEGGADPLIETAEGEAPAFGMEDHRPWKPGNPNELAVLQAFKKAGAGLRSLGKDQKRYSTLCVVKNLSIS